MTPGNTSVRDRCSAGQPESTRIIAVLHFVDRLTPATDLNPESIGIKGSKPSLRVHRKTKAGSELLRAGALVRRGDTLQVGYLAAGKQRGVQIGLVNIADEIDGVQIGLVSFARRCNGASIGLFPIVLEGENHLTLGWNTTSAANLGFKLGTRHVYVAAGVGITHDTEQNGARYYAGSFGLGAHALPRGRRFFLDIDISVSNFATLSPAHHADRFVATVRLQAGWSFARRLAIVAGPTLNRQVALGNDDRLPRGVGFAEDVTRDRGYTIRTYPGLSAGLEF